MLAFGYINSCRLAAPICLVNEPNDWSTAKIKVAAEDLKGGTGCNLIGTEEGRVGCINEYCWTPANAVCRDANSHHIRQPCLGARNPERRRPVARRDRRYGGPIGVVVRVLDEWVRTEVTSLDIDNLAITRRF
jgi:hypothetical protein